MNNTHKHVTIAVPNEKIRDVLSCAFESGGVNYWMRRGKEVGKREAKRDLERDLTAKSSACCWLPLSEFGAVGCLEVDEDTGVETLHVLDLAAIRRGLAVMIEKYPRRFADILDGDDCDMHTGDLFVQCCLFGDEKYA